MWLGEEVDTMIGAVGQVGVHGLDASDNATDAWPGGRVARGAACDGWDRLSEDWTS